MNLTHGGLHFNKLLLLLVGNLLDQKFWLPQLMLDSWDRWASLLSDFHQWQTRLSYSMSIMRSETHFLVLFWNFKLTYLTVYWCLCAVPEGYCISEGDQSVRACHQCFELFSSKFTIGLASLVSTVFILLSICTCFYLFI